MSHLLGPHETELVGRWLVENGKVVADDVTRRIEHLTRNVLVKRATGDWTILFQDPADGRYWQLGYPQSEMHGGGPPDSRVIDPVTAASVFGEEALKREAIRRRFTTSLLPAGWLQ